MTKKKANGKKTTKKAVSKVDTQTRKLFADLMGGVQSYTKTFLGSSGGPVTLPSQHAIDEARGLLDDAMARVGAIEQGMKSPTEKKLVAAQVADQQLGNMTKLLYGIIPKAVSQTTKKSAADDSCASCPRSERLITALLSLQISSKETPGGSMALVIEPGPQVQPSTSPWLTR